jgi:hypothetical protein
MTTEVTLDVAGARVTLPAATLTNLWLEQVRGKAGALIGYPKIGFAFDDQPGIYAGIVVGDDKFQADYHLVVLDADREALPWADAKAWAASIGGELPKRKEQAVMFGNVPQLFEKAWYWSCEEHASYPDYAWAQNFDYGRQHDYRKAFRCRARAVRRIPI